MSNKLTKKCINCKVSFTKKPNTSIKNWELSKFFVEIVNITTVVFQLSVLCAINCLQLKNAIKID